MSATLLNPDEALDRLAAARQLWLFLDYDGTLADFALTPDHVTADPDLVDLLGRLARLPALRLAVISGRRLSHVEKLVPLPGIWRAGTYGVELRSPAGERVARLAYAEVRPPLERLKPRWEALIADREGFYLEDKGWTLALHARHAAADEARPVLASARDAAREFADGDLLRLLDGHRFLEVAPQLADKGRAVRYLLDEDPWPGAEVAFLGDDDKDEKAFSVVKGLGGLPVLVSPEPRETSALCRLSSPAAAREWLDRLRGRLEAAA